MINKQSRPRPRKTISTLTVAQLKEAAGGDTPSTPSKKFEGPSMEAD